MGISIASTSRQVVQTCSCRALCAPAAACEQGPERPSSLAQTKLALAAIKALGQASKLAIFPLPRSCKLSTASRARCLACPEELPRRCVVLRAAPASCASDRLAVHVNQTCFRPRLGRRSAGSALLKLPQLLLFRGALRPIARP